MNIRKSGSIIFAALCMTAMILDTRTGFQGAIHGLDICIRSLIPSLFPFFIFSAMLTASLLGKYIKVLRPLEKLCRIPKGSGSLLAIGFLSGYPTGVQNVALSWKKGHLSRNDAERMAAFCNNAGPAFLFGYLGQLFQNPLLPHMLWLIHIFSALLVAILVPGGPYQEVRAMEPGSISFPEALDQSLRGMARVCGWVILFRVVLEFLTKWFFWFLPPLWQVLLTGFLELSNGCLMLPDLPSDGMRFLFASIFLGFGGICVLMQTNSVAQGLPLRLYLPGKLLQGSVSFLLAYGLQLWLIPDDCVHLSPVVLGAVLAAAVLSAVILRKIEKPVAISQDLLYNGTSYEKRRTLCCSGKRSSVPAPTAFTVPN